MIQHRNSPKSTTVPFRSLHCRLEIGPLPSADATPSSISIESKSVVLVNILTKTAPASSLLRPPPKDADRYDCDHGWPVALRSPSFLGEPAPAQEEMLELLGAKTWACGLSIPQVLTVRDDDVMAART
jgi:hypothetical protein